MIRKAVIIYVAYCLLAVSLSGCCNCPPATERTIRWTGLRLNTRPYTIDADSAARSIADTSTDFRNKQCLLRATVNYEFIAANKNFLFNLFNEAYACKCAEQVINAQKPITNLRIFTVHDFDAGHLAGSDITDRFGSPYTLNGSLHGIGPLELYFPVAQYQGNEPYTIYDLYLAIRPTAGSMQQFKVVVTLSDSTNYSEFTPVLRF